MIELFKEPRIIGLVSNANQGKSNTIYYILSLLSNNYTYKCYAYGLRNNIKEVQNVHSVEELEQIRDSLIVIDEMSSLFDLDNRKIKKQIENMIRLIYHNNNVLILSGLGENFKKFISAKLHAIIYKKVFMDDLINGSTVKRVLSSYKGYELGSTVLNLPINKALVWNGSHYKVVNIPYMECFDSKKDNVQIMSKKRPEKRAKNGGITITV